MVVVPFRLAGSRRARRVRHRKPDPRLALEKRVDHAALPASRGRCDDEQASRRARTACGDRHGAGTLRGSGVAALILGLLWPAMSCEPPTCRGLSIAPALRGLARL